MKKKITEISLCMVMLSWYVPVKIDFYLRPQLYLAFHYRVIEIATVVFMNWFTGY